MRFSAGERNGSGFASDISARGLFLQCNLLPAHGAEIELAINDTTRGKLRCVGRVVRLKTTHRSAVVINPGGFGVELASASEGYYALVAALTEEDAKGRASGAL